MNTTKRGVGLVRLSKSADPASTSVPRQKSIIEGYTEHEGIEIVGWAIDEATSAFRVPPEKRKQVKQWLDRPGDFDCFVYYRQDRLVRRLFDFVGLVTWCKANDKKLYSATEGMGDVTEQAGMLVGVIKAWQAEGESESTSARVKDQRADFAKIGRWPGGRIPYAFRPVCICHDVKVCPELRRDPKSAKFSGYHLVPDPKKAKIVREAVRRVIAGESVHSVMADFNRRGIPSADGRLWTRYVLRNILHNKNLLDGIVSADEWNQLQAALKARERNRTVRTTGHDSPLLDIVFCGNCGGKIYRWTNRTESITYGRCRNEKHRSSSRTPCHMPMIQYDKLQSMALTELWVHKDEKVKEPVTDATRRLRQEQIAKELLDLMPEFMSNHIDRETFLAQQSALLDEQETLRNAANVGTWRETGETVGQKLQRVSDAELRLWLLRIGTRYKLYRVGNGWQLRGHWMSETIAGHEAVVEDAG